MNPTTIGQVIDEIRKLTNHDSSCAGVIVPAIADKFDLTETVVAELVIDFLLGAYS